MVIKSNVIHDMRYRINQISELVKVNHLSLQRVVKRFHIRIVPTATLATLTDQQVMFIEHSFQLFVRELRATIAMEYGALKGLMILKRHQQED